ncbi:aminoglycoside phosphotransferase family protein [Solibacillus sp. CAU 1738]|uniref:aminoglycoside phosphotransferase family protein n=1 Tax=Solibacillus sp. CAU 1738 TaxID=3140363 RepID=UPI0032612253
MIEQILKEIVILKNHQQIIKINKGFSLEEKYIIALPDSAEKYLLRFFPVNQLEGKINELKILERMQNLNVKATRAVDAGEVAGKGYMITTFIEGEDGEEALPMLASSDQYQIGFEAGRELYKMHQLEAPNDIQSWYERKRTKHYRYIDSYKKCGIRFEQDEKIMEFIDQRINLMLERPNIFQHDDFHPSNLIIKNDRLAGIIDFGRYDYGDPIHEFLKVGMFTRNISIPFSIGQIKGYFNGEAPTENFWNLYSLYLAMSIFSSVVWILKVAENDIDNMLEKINVILKDHEYFNNTQPSWYEKFGGQNNER